MIGTSDAGCHWQKIYTGSYNFMQMQFLNNSIGYALAQTNPQQPNVLLRTANGGTSFKTINTAGQRFERIQFHSISVGFGYTRAFTYKTTDAGQTWSKVATPPNTRYAHFITPDKGWIVVLRSGGYEVKRTIDGGRTWSDKLSVNSAAVVGGAVYGTDSSDIWVLLYGGSGMSQTSYSLYHTKDAGSHWKQIISKATAGGGPAPGKATDKLPGPQGRPTDMQVIGSQAAFLAAGSGALDHISLGRSLNDGATWSNLKAVPGYEAKLSFTSAKNGWIAVTSVSEPSIYATTDSGKTWTKKITLPGEK